MNKEQSTKFAKKSELKFNKKTNSPRLIFFMLLLHIICFQCFANADEQNNKPDYVKALIGIKHDHKNETPGFYSLGGSLLAEIDKKISITISEGFAGTTPAFVISKVINLPNNKGSITEILDAQEIPHDMYEWRLNMNKKSFPRADHIHGRYKLSDICSYRISGIDTNTIIGLVKPEIGKENCGHDSRHVGRSWEIDRKTGHIKNVSTKGIQCYYPLIDSCQ